MRGIYTWVKRIVGDISFWPTILIVLFVIIGFLQLGTTRAQYTLPPWLERLDLQDLSTIRTMLAAIIGGLFTLTIFTYTMVMNVIDRSVSTYSPRLLPLLTHEKYHQLTLGVSLGTIAHAIILLLGTTENTALRPHPPVLAAASSALLALVCLVLFIYFIHHVTQSIHINKLLRKSYAFTREQLAALQDTELVLSHTDEAAAAKPTTNALRAQQCGYLQGLQLDHLTELAASFGTPINVVQSSGGFAYAGDVLVRYGEVADQSAFERKLRRVIEVSAEEPIQVHETGFKHLVEVAVKACSPALNDPATALTAVHYLTQLFLRYQKLAPFNTARKPGGSGTVYFNHFSYDELLQSSFDELRCYLCDDPWTRRAVDDAWERIHAEPTP